MVFGVSRQPAIALMVVCTASVRRWRRPEVCSVEGEDIMYMDLFLGGSRYFVGVMDNRVGRQM